MWRETRRRGKERILGERTEENASTEAKGKQTIDETKEKYTSEKGERRMKREETVEV